MTVQEAMGWSRCAASGGAHSRIHEICPGPSLRERAARVAANQLEWARCALVEARLFSGKYQRERTLSYERSILRLVTALTRCQAARRMARALHRQLLEMWREGAKEAA